MKTLFTIVVFVVCMALSTGTVMAIQDPLAVPNNKYGIHILFPGELEDAAKLVNSSGGDWGYVTIPIQAGDRDLGKWQKFMDDAKRLHLIPIVRLATEGDYFNTQVWRKPNYGDVIDFANFLDSLNWPTKHRYVIVFNEVNRNDEWGGEANPQEYADILSYAYTVFKSRNQDFFVLPSGMDNVAATVPGQAINQYTFFEQMQAAVPGIFNQIDGHTSHSYPNPAFAQPPSSRGPTTTASFSYEVQLLESYSNKTLPVFITETGWARNAVSDEQAATYWQEVTQTTWNNERIVAITPFILRAGTPPFDVFSFFNVDGSQTKTYQAYYALPKTKGQPILVQHILGEKTAKKGVPYTAFHNSNVTSTFSLSRQIKDAFKWLLKIQ